jgi:hypothetical protein
MNSLGDIRIFLGLVPKDSPCICLKAFAATKFSKIFSGSHSIPSPCPTEAHIPDSMTTTYQQRPEDGDRVGP